MDEKDIILLEKLLDNSRMKNIELAKELNLSEGSIRYRIRRLIENKVIMRFTIDVNPKVFSVSLTGIDVEPEKLLDVLNELKKIKEIKAIYLTAGDHDIIVKIICNNSEKLKEIHKKIEKVDGVKRVCPAIITEIVR